MSSYLGHFLSAAKGTESCYYSEPLTIRPGFSFSDDQSTDNSILLVGGFSRIHPDSAFPLSSTLQLNGDLSGIDAEHMADLAKAEFDRYRSQSYRAYTQEVDSRLTVLSADAASLHAFIDIYGGVLTIDPILTKEYDPELTTAQDIEIKQHGDGLLLRFNVKQAIDFDCCNYCGDCGASCPETCVTEQLFLDFSKCTLCKECVTACSQNAIDLHAVEGRTLSTPALLALDGAGVVLPEIQENIYSEKDLPALFEQIYIAEIEEVIRWDENICQYSARLESGCSACVDSCVHHAISQSKAGVVVAHSACVECGACLSSCPTGALQYERFDDNAFVNYFKGFSFTPGSTVIIGTEAALHKLWWESHKKPHSDVFFLEYPQPVALHAMHFLLLFAKGAGQIMLLGQESDSNSKQVEFTNTIIRHYFNKEQSVQVVPAVSGNSSLLDNIESNTLVKSVYQNFSYANRRAKLVEILQFLSLSSEGGLSDCVGSISGDFGSVLCDDKACTGCVACVGECRIGALSTDGSSYSLSHTPALCVQCGLCVSICPEDALSLQAGLSLHDEFFNEHILAKAEPAQCKGCGKVFGTKKSLEKVMSILTAKGMWDKTDDLLSYCDDCRVINLYKSCEHERAKRTD